MSFVYEVILDFINAWFPNDLRIELLALNELLAYILTVVLACVLIKGLLRLFRLVRK